jgi:hypothetical protein
LLDELFGLGAGNSITRLSDHTMDAQAIDHDIDGIPEIAIVKPLGGDAVLGDPLAGLQPTDGRTIEARKSQGHICLPLPMLRK